MNSSLFSLAGGTAASSSVGAFDRQLLAQIAQSVSVTIQDMDEMESAYIRTRHNNIRCFPKCAKVHKTKSFCGTPLFVNVSYLTGNMPLSIKDVVVIGEFRNVRKPPTFTIMQSCLPKQRELPSLVSGHVSECNGKIQFTINPPRKWRYRARIAQVLDMHVFTVYVLMNDIVVAIKDTPQFQVIPIWKADDNLLRFNDGGEEEEDEIMNEEDDGDEAEGPALVQDAMVQPRATLLADEIEMKAKLLAKRMKSFDGIQPNATEAGIGNRFNGQQPHSEASSAMNTNQQVMSASNPPSLSSSAGYQNFSPRVLSNIRLDPMPSTNSDTAGAAAAPQPAPPSNNNHSGSVNSSNAPYMPHFTHQYTPQQLMPNPMMAPSFPMVTGHHLGSNGGNPKMMGYNGNNNNGDDVSPSASSMQSSFGFNNNNHFNNNNDGASSFYNNNGNGNPYAASIAAMSLTSQPNNGNGNNGGIHVSPIPPTYASATQQPMNGAMHVGPEAFGQLQYHNMGVGVNPPPPSLQNHFLTNLLSNAYLTGHAFTNFQQQQQQQNQPSHFVSGMMSPLSSAQQISGKMMMESMMPAGGSALPPHLTNTIDGNVGSAVPSSSSSAGASSTMQQKHQERSAVHLSNSKNTKDKHQD